MRRSYGFIIPGILILTMVSAFTHGPRSRSLEFTYAVMIHDIPFGTQEVRIWLPYLMENDQQILEEVNLEASEDLGAPQITYDKTYHNKMIHYVLKEPQGSSLELKAHYKLKRFEYSPKTASVPVEKLNNEENLQQYLSANRLVTLSADVRELADRITKDQKTTMAKAHAIYDYVLQNVSYDKTIPGWGNGDTQRVCLVKAGNCTDFHSLFISLARSSGIPAKFVMGLSLPQNQKEGEISGYHCWAEFYDGKEGWVPVDISEAWKDQSKYQYYFGTIPKDRLELTQGRDIVLEPVQNAQPLNYFFYPHVEVDGEIFNQVTTTFKFKDKS